MPCDSNYLSPAQWELDLAEVIDLLDYVQTMRGARRNGKTVRRGAPQCHGHASKQADLEPLVVKLCAILRRLPPAEFDRLVYNGRSRMSRHLADWWETHDAADKEREAKEQKKLQEQQIVAAAKKKLTPKERKALGLL